MKNKNIMVRATLALFVVLSISSCVKVWTCKCEVKNLDPKNYPYGYAPYIEGRAPGLKKKRKADCDEMKESYTKNFQHEETVECELK